MENYEKFKKAVQDNLMSFAPKEYKDATIEILKMRKINGEKDGLIIRREYQPVSPVIYLREMYERFQQESEDLSAVMQEIWETIVTAEARGEQFEIFTNSLFDCTDDIIMRVVNTAANEAILSDYPHRELLDLSILYYKLVQEDERGAATMLITNKIAELMSFTEEQLYKLAAENTSRLLPAKVQSIREVLAGMMPDDFLPEDDDVIPMRVITNDRMQYGACVMFYDGVLEQLAKKLDSDIYILPSSIHEVLAVPVSHGEPEELIQMVRAVNGAEVAPEEVLSNSVYRYNRDTKEIAIA